MEHLLNVGKNFSQPGIVLNKLRNCCGYKTFSKEVAVNVVTSATVLFCK
jgi:hypothetical protein